MNKKTLMLLTIPMFLVACGDENTGNNQNNQQQQNNNKDGLNNDEIADAMLSSSCILISSGFICSSATVNNTSNHYIISCDNGEVTNKQKCQADEKCFKDEGQPYCSTERHFPFDTAGLCDGNESVVCYHGKDKEYIVSCREGKAGNFSACNQNMVCKFDSQKNKNQCMAADANSDIDSNSDSSSDK